MGIGLVETVEKTPLGLMSQQPGIHANVWAELAEIYGVNEFFLT